MNIDNAHAYLPELWGVHARFRPNHEALVCGDVRRTWREFDQNMSKVANGLLAEGVKQGDKVAVLMNNSVETLETIFGVVRAGACVVPLSSLLTADQLKVLITDCGARTVICSAEYMTVIDEIRDDPSSVSAERFIVSGADKTGWRPADEVFAAAGNVAPAVARSMDDDFNIIYSSGTTGLPKGIVQTHRARQHWAWSNAVEMRFHRGARAMTTTPVYSNGTWLMILPALFSGGTVVILPQFDPLTALKTIVEEQITHTFMVPTQYIMTLAEPTFDQHDLSGLEAVLCAGSPLRPDTKADVLARMTSNLYELYGFSEGFATMNRPDMHAEKPTSVGTPVLGFDVKIIDDDGNELGADEPGEIAGYGAGMMKAYHNRPEATDDIIWHAPDGRTFLRSGDIGKLDEDGHLYILDRKKDMIISGGFNIFPADIEAIIGEHEAVRDVTVIGIPHEKWGETPMALVIPEEGAVADEILDWSDGRLAKHQRLSAVDFRDEFPRNALGKVIKRMLRDQIAAQDS